MIQIPYALGIVVVLLFQNRQIILIGMAYQMGRTQFLCPRETLQCVRQVLEPHTRTPGYLAQGLKGLVRFDQGRQEILRLLRPHPFHQHEHTMPADRIERIRNDPHMGKQIFHVSCFDKFDTSALDKGQTFPRKFDLQVKGMETGSKQHRHLAQRYPLLAKLQNLLRNKPRLCIFTSRLHQSW